MQTGSEEGFQIATLVVVVVTILVVVAYLLIFLNPRIALNPFKPLLPTATLVAGLPPTWTPTPTDTATPTLTPTATSTATLALPTVTPMPTAIPAPILVATLKPPTRPAPALPPTPIPLPYSFRSVPRSCTFGTPAQIKGKVTSGGSPMDGIRVRLATSMDAATVVDEQAVKRDSDTSTIYAFIISPPDSGSFQWHVWVTDASGTALSDPNFHVTINNAPASDPNACWIAIVDFAR